MPQPAWLRADRTSGRQSVSQEWGQKLGLHHSRICQEDSRDLSLRLLTKYRVENRSQT